jgi:hypothetical protein
MFGSLLFKQEAAAVFQILFLIEFLEEALN